MTRVADLISPAYLTEQVMLHAAPRGYGQKGRKWAPTVLAIAAHYQCASVLDYGAGQGSLAVALRAHGSSDLRIAEYDPAVAGKSALPTFADLVVCTDVLEHIEPDYLDRVLLHLGQLARRAILLVVALDPSGKVMTDGRNAHIIQESAAWWADRVQASGLTEEPWQSTWPIHLTAEKRQRRWIAVVRP